MPEPIIQAKGLVFRWTEPSDLLNIPAFEMKAGERLFLRGPSGSGKSTLLGLIAGVLTPQAGHLEVLGQDMMSLSGGQRDRLRADGLGVIFQMFNLVPYLSVVQNVVLPCRFSKARRVKASERGGVDAEARRLLERLGLSDPNLLSRKVTDLSVGQQQRVAAARALIGSPQLIIADEPTSALDADARDRFIHLLSEEVQQSGAGLLFVSHDGGLSNLFERAIDLSTLNAAKRVEVA